MDFLLLLKEGVELSYRLLLDGMACGVSFGVVSADMEIVTYAV